MIVAPLTCSVAILGAAAAPAVAAPRWPIALSLYAHGNHARPIPGELQNMRWSVRNDGAQRLDRVRLDIRPPAGWLLRYAPGCAPLGPLLRCALGPLRPGRWVSAHLRFAIPAHPRLGSVRITGRTAAVTGNALVSGPSTFLVVTVVHHR